MKFFRRRPVRALGLRRGAQAPQLTKYGLGVDRSLTGSADLSEFATPVSDQFSVSRCVAHGLSGAVYTTLEARGAGLGFIPDVDLLYSLCLRTDRARDYPLTLFRDLPPLRDAGTRLDTGVSVISRYGLAPSVREPSKTFEKKSPLMVGALVSGSNLLIGAYSVSNLSDAALALERGRSLAIGGFWGSALFDRRSDAHPIDAQPLDDPSGGGHCVELLGYRTIKTGREWLIKNSWGASWGTSGYAWSTDNFIRQQWSVWVLDVQRTSK